MDLAELRRLLDREALIHALEPHRGRDTRIAEWIDRLKHQHGGIEDSGARGLDRALGVLLDGVAMRGSLRNCPEALRLDDVLDTNGLVLFSLDDLTYPHATRKLAAARHGTLGATASYIGRYIRRFSPCRSISEDRESAARAAPGTRSARSDPVPATCEAWSGELVRPACPSSWPRRDSPTWKRSTATMAG